MTRFSLRGALAALALTAACGSAHAFSAGGNYDVTFAVVGGGTVTACATLVSQGANGPYRDNGTAAIYFTGQTVVPTGTYVVSKRTIALAVQSLSGGGAYFLTASGDFGTGQTFNTSVIQFDSQATIEATATFQDRRNHAPCTSS